MADSDTMQPAGLPADVSSSLGSLWKQYSGERPTDIETNIQGTRIACVLKDAVQGFDDNLAVVAAAGVDPEVRQLTSKTYRHDAIQAVTRVTRRRVMAFVSDHDAKTGIATEVFIEDTPMRTPRSMFVERRFESDTP
jgi:uncharacterized protein YbcI